MSHNISNNTKSSIHFEAFFKYATMGILVTDGGGYITAIINAEAELKKRVSSLFNLKKESR